MGKAGRPSAAKASTLPGAYMAPREAQHVLVLDVGAALPQGTPSRNSCELVPGLPASGLKKERSRSQTSRRLNEVISAIVTLGDLMTQKSKALCPWDRKCPYTAQLMAK